MNAKLFRHGSVGLVFAAMGGLMLFPAITDFAMIMYHEELPPDDFWPEATISVILLLAGVSLRVLSAHQCRLALAVWRDKSHFNASVEDRLDELERLKRRDMVTPEEYAAKRQEILRDL